MSIYATSLCFDGDEDPAPILYRGSHVMPSDADPRDGLVELALIPSFISRTGDDGPEDEAPLPWLRLSVAARVAPDGTAPGMQDVLLDAGQVRVLRDALTAWFYPPGEAPEQPTRAEVAAALTHDSWCDLIQHKDCCGKDECNCAVQDLVGELVARRWLVLAEEETGDA